MNRRQFVNVASMAAATAAIGGVAASARGAGAGKQRAVHVRNGANRFGEQLMIWGVIPLQIKVSSKDTGGELFVFEHADMGKGGPPRHFHYEQDEWFYALKGEFAFEVGDERFILGPGDSLFAPRMVPHVWTCATDTGTLMLAVQPAGSLEQFFMESSRMTRPPTPEEAAKHFAAHGMKVVGPPL